MELLAGLTPDRLGTFPGIIQMDSDRFAIYLPNGEIGGADVRRVVEAPIVPREPEPYLTNCVRELRGQAEGMNQQALADAVGVTRQTIVAMETG